jgi:hypothetical protein
VWQNLGTPPQCRTSLSIFDFPVKAQHLSLEALQRYHLSLNAAIHEMIFHVLCSVMLFVNSLTAHICLNQNYTGAVSKKKPASFLLSTAKKSM